MTEHLHASPEKNQEIPDVEAESRFNLERIQNKTEIENVTPEKIEKLQRRAEQEAISGKEVTVGEHEEAQNQQQTASLMTHKELKADAYARTLQKVRQHLNVAEKLFSRFTHKAAIETMSEAGAKTLARPSGLLGGGIASLAGSGVLLYMTKHYGFHYNFFVFFLLFIGGFLAGIVGELLVRIVLHPR